jgi:heme/copper-type cytochrome/quinol oxidase subunit 2
MNYIIPTILLLAMIVISYKMYKEYTKRKRAKAIQSKREEETRFIIEKRVMRDILTNEKWWLNKDSDTIRCSFDRCKYVEYLEAR